MNNTMSMYNKIRNMSREAITHDRKKLNNILQTI